VDWTPDRQRWLEESCRASGVPLKVDDPATIAKVAVLLGAGGNVAKNQARRQQDAIGSSSRRTREVGNRGNSRPRDDVHVRRARRYANGDARLLGAKAEQEEHERKLAALDAALSTQVHVPYRPLTVVPEPQEQPAVPTVTKTVDVKRARELIGQGYHIDRVVAVTGAPIEMLKNLVGPDGYRTGRG
jgi:hypothetical protein